MAEGKLSEGKRSQKKRCKITADENVRSVREAANSRPGEAVSVREVSFITDIAKTSVNRILKKTINFKPWRPIRCHGLKDEDYAKRRDFGQHMLNLHRNDPGLFSKMLENKE